MTSSLRLAILGMGWAGTRHVEAIRELGRKVVVDCIVDNDADFLKAKAAELGIAKTYTDYHDALTDADVDAVSICLPHALHCPVAVEAAVAGKHILCEKPLSMTVDEATQMMDMAEAYGVKLYVAENICYTPEARCLHEIVRTGEHIGELTFAALVRGFQAQQYGYPGRRAWLSTPELGGTGVWMLNGIHTIAYLRYVLGEVATVYVQEHKASSFARDDLEGTMHGLLTLESGVSVSVVQTPETKLPNNLGGFTLFGDQGVVRQAQGGIEVFNKALDPDHKPVFIPYPEESFSAYALEMEAFADYVRGIATGPTTARSERRSLAIVQAGYESAASGKVVDLKERFGEL